MGEALWIAYLWLLHGLVTVPVVASVVWFARRRVQWHWWELSVFVVPFALWLGLIHANLRPKTLGNLGECFLISAAIVVGTVLRPVATKRVENRTAAAVLLAAVTAFALGVYWLTPALPE